MKLRSGVLVAGSALLALLVVAMVWGAAGALAAGDPAAGKEVFTGNGCGGCHTLADAGAKGKSATNLDTGKLSSDTIVNAVTNGVDSMPSYNSTLSAVQIENLAAYIVKVAGSKPASKCSGKKGTALKKCKALIKCKKLSGKKKAACIKKAKKIGKKRKK